MPRRSATIARVLFLAAGTAAVVWAGLGWPPPRLVLRYGLPPAGGPTGRTKSLGIRDIQETEDGKERSLQLEFVELAPGYACEDRHRARCEEGDPPGRITEAIGVEAGNPPQHLRPACRRWVVLPEQIWMSRTPAYPSILSMLAWEIAPDPERDRGLIENIELVSRRREGDFRLATQDEYSFAWSHEAIETEIYEIGVGLGPAGEPEVIELLPEKRFEGLFSGGVPCRLVWTPDPAGP